MRSGGAPRRSQGYRAAIEHEGIDVVIVHGDQSLAIEISVSTRPDDELRNIRRSLARGYRRMLVACLDRTAMGKAAELMSAELPREQRAYVTLCTMGNIGDHLVF